MAEGLSGKPIEAVKPCLFLSHSGADTEARELRRRILASPAARDAGLKVWSDKDENDLVPGKEWQNQLELVLTKKATAFADYVGSKGVINWVEREVRLALSRATGENDLPFIPILAPEFGRIGSTAALRRAIPWRERSLGRREGARRPYQGGARWRHWQTGFDRSTLYRSQGDDRLRHRHRPSRSAKSLRKFHCHPGRPSGTKRSNMGLSQSLVFSGHMIDLPERPNPRFPARLEAAARSAICAKVRTPVRPGLWFLLVARAVETFYFTRSHGSSGSGPSLFFHSHRRRS